MLVLALVAAVSMPLPADSLPAFTLPAVEVTAPAPDSAVAEPRADVISESQLRRTPATADDVFRVVQTLPGVASSDYSASFLVRGGESDETLVRMDGIDLLEPYHIPYWGGALSIVSPDAVHSVRLVRGGLPARYGRQLSGALEIDSPDDRPSGPFYRLGAGPTQLRALVAGPMEGGGSYLFGVRHGLLAALERLHRVRGGAWVEPDFQDVIGGLRFRPGLGHEVRLLGIGAREKLRYDMPYDESDLSGTVRNVTVGATWTARVAPGRRYRAVLSADRFHRARTVGTSGTDAGVTRALRSRLEGELPLGSGHALEWGMAAEYEDTWLILEGIRGSMVESGYQEQIEHQVSGTAARRRVEGFLSWRAAAGSRASVTTGVNVSRDFYSWGLKRDGVPMRGTPGFAFVSPRLLATARLGSVATVWTSLGLMHQPTFLNNLDEDRAALPLGRDREAAEAIAGFETRTGPLTLRAEGYLRNERGLGLPVQDATTHPAPPFTLDRGSSRGLEVVLKTPSWRRLDVSIGYAWSRAVWATPSGPLARSFDQPHAATLSLNVRPTQSWNVNATARYHTGSPYTEAAWTRADSSNTWTRAFGPFMGARYPAYVRVDFRLSRPLNFGPTGGEVYLELVNATGHQNVHMYTYEFRPDEGGVTPRRVAVELFPRMPSAGVQFSF